MVGRRVRRNADEKLRRLERQAAEGDPTAARLLDREVVRTGILANAVTIITRHAHVLSPVQTQDVLASLAGGEHELVAWEVVEHSEGLPPETQGLFSSPVKAWREAAGIALDIVVAYLEDQEEEEGVALALRLSDEGNYQGVVGMLERVGMGGAVEVAEVPIR